jgi:2-polyprenyl-3-methyl-5-hydroxy-6-metoxy-1,4-benzoquinol methylase
VETYHYEYPFDPDKRNNTAASVFRLVRDGGVRVLDLGSGPGIVAGALATMADKEVTCVDIESTHLESAAERGVQRTIRSDLTSPTWTDQLAGEQFDVIVLADVLEHLVDPADLVTRLRDQQLLAPGGRIVVSIPNASHIALLALLATGDFPYRPAGLLDATHLRFFTLTSMRRLLEETGFTITRVRRTTKPLRKTEFKDVVDLIDPDTLRQLSAQHEESDTYQYVLQVEPLSSEAVRDLRERLRRSEKQRRRLRQRTKELEQRIDEVYASQTWRAGRAIVKGPAAMRRAMTRRG